MSNSPHIAIEVRRLDSPLHLSFIPHAATTDPCTDPVWLRLTTENPRLHDGPLILIDDIHEATTLHCRGGTYREFVTAQAANRHVEALGVSGIIRLRDANDRFLTLLGKRGPQTRIYGNAWETAPRGSVTPPPLGVSLTLHTLESQLIDECREEIGVDFARGSFQPFATVRDPHARSLDIVFVAALNDADHARVDSALKRGGNWEYSILRWANIEKDADTLMPDLSPPTAALVRAMRDWA